MPSAVLPDRTRSDFTPLARQVRAAGLIERRRLWYAGTIATNAVLGAATCALMVALGGTWWQLLLTVPAAFLTARTCFIGHDACHQQIARTKRVNRWIGLLHGNFGIGMSYAWWADKHNRHHAHPNHTEKDPDVGAGLLAWTRDQARGRTGWLGLFTRHQAALFFPLLLLEGLNLKISGIRYLRTHPGPGQRTESILIGLHIIGYLTLLFVVMSPGQAVVFMLLHQALVGLHLGSVFAPNHKGMPMAAPGVKWGHLQRQVLTSRNVEGGPLVDWIFGGLNYQIEHHLFPSLPRPNLRRAQPLVRAHCAEVGIPYTQQRIVDSYRMALRHMHRVGAG
jgi:fatty acid desaturase